MKIGIILFAILIVIAGLVMLGVYLKKKGILDDKNNNHVPDFADKAIKKTSHKVKEVFNEAEQRVDAIITESKDVAKAIKEVGNQIGDLPKAAAGKKRSGRKAKK